MERNAFGESARDSTRAQEIREEFTADLVEQQPQELASGLSEALDAAITTAREASAGVSPFYTTRGRTPRNG